jgi:Glycosyltransferase family 87
VGQLTTITRTSARRVRSFWHAIAPLLLVATIVVVFLPLTRSYDLDVFLRAGYAVVHGLQVYPSPGSPAVYSGSSFVYPYFAAWPFVALAGMSSGLSSMVFFFACVCAVLVACIVGAKGDLWPATLTLCSAFTITGLQLGALSPLLFVGVVFLWRLRHRPLGFALLAAPVVACKLFLAPLLVWTLLARRYRTFAYASASTLALLALSFGLGPIGPAQYLHVISQLGTHEAQSGFGLIGALMDARLAPAAAQAIAVAVTLALFAAAYVHFRRTRDERVLFCAGIVASLVLTPVLWSHYLILLSAALLTLGAPRRWFVMLALASWAISPPHGVHWDTDLIGGISSSGTWVAVALVVFAYASVRARGTWNNNPRRQVLVRVGSFMEASVARVRRTATRRRTPKSPPYPQGPANDPQPTAPARPW